VLPRTLHRMCPLVLHRQEFWGRMNEAASTGAGFLPLLTGWDSALALMRAPCAWTESQLLHHAHHVGLAIRFHDLAVHDAVHLDDFPGRMLAGRRHPHEGPLMRPADHDARGYPLAVGHRRLDLSLKVRKSSAELGIERLRRGKPGVRVHKSQVFPHHGVTELLYDGFALFDRHTDLPGGHP